MDKRGMEFRSTQAMSLTPWFKHFEDQGKGVRQHYTKGVVLLDTDVKNKKKSK